MKVQFDWQAGDEEGRWETIATTERHPAFRVPRRVWRMLLLAAIVVALGGTLGVRYRYQVALQRLTLDIQAVVDLETWALERGDRDLFLALQDEALPEWYWHQDIHFLMYRAPCASSRPVSGPLTADGASAFRAEPGAAPSMRQEDCVAGPHPKVQRVQLRGDVAWVHVVEGHHRMLRARFYQQTLGGWKHTAPRPEFWVDPVERRYGAVTVRAQPNDLAHVEPLVEHLSRVVDEVSATLDHRANQRLEVDFVCQDSPYRVPALKAGRLILPSPWLTGIPVEGAWDPEYLDTLDYWAAYWVASRYVQPTGSLSALQRAFVDEYAVLYSRGDVAQAPILDQAIKQHDLDLLPEILASLRGPEEASAFLERWLSASPSKDEVYLDTLASIGWKAFVGGRVDSYSLVQQVLAREGVSLTDRLESDWIENE
jgi:hypothetical protein